jgi:hypothetical protein
MSCYFGPVTELEVAGTGDAKYGADVLENANTIFIFSLKCRQSVFENEWSWQPSPTSDLIAFFQIGRHGGKTIYLLDIWLLYSDAQKDHRLRSWKRKLNKSLWAWGM